MRQIRISRRSSATPRPLGGNEGEVISGAQCYASNPHFAAQLRHSPPPGRRSAEILVAVVVGHRVVASEPSSKWASRLRLAERVGRNSDSLCGIFRRGRVAA